VSTQELKNKLAGSADESALEEGEIRDTDEIGQTHELDEHVAQEGQRATGRRMGVDKRDLALDDVFRQELEEKEVLDETACAQSAGGTDLRSPALCHRRRLCSAWVLGSCRRHLLYQWHRFVFNNDGAIFLFLYKYTFNHVIDHIQVTTTSSSTPAPTSQRFTSVLSSSSSPTPPLSSTAPSSMPTTILLASPISSTPLGARKTSVVVEFKMVGMGPPEMTLAS
jgi:hypothetical protein